MMKMIVALLLSVTCLTNVSAQSKARGTTASERAQLPKYCYFQYIDEKLAGQPDYSIPKSCGKRMNHFCPGLMDLIRAQKISDSMGNRRKNAGKAIQSINYSLRDMPPGCPLRADAEAALVKAKAIAGR